MTQQTALYRHFDAEGALLYIGISGGWFRRTAEHMKSSPWWREVSHIEITYYQNKADALAAETDAIARENPRHNKQKSVRRTVPNPAAMRSEVADSLSLKSAAVLLGISYTFLRSLVAKGDICATRDGPRRLYITRAEIKDFIRRNTIGRAPP